MKRCIESDKERSGLPEASVPRVFYATFPARGYVHQPKNSPTPKFMEASQRSAIYHLNLCLPFFPQRMGSGGWKFQASNHAWLGLSSGQRSSISPVGVTSLRQNMLLLPRIYQGFRSSVPGNRFKHQILKQRMLLALLLLYSYQEMTGVLGDLG